jgi:CDP-diacylglycerol pyrophosphatase
MRNPILLVLALLPSLAAAQPRTPNPDVLWHIVSEQCLPDLRTNGVSAPCVSIDLAGGSVVMRDFRGATQFLLVPTAKVTGIEDAAILAPGAPNYFAAAWRSIGLVAGAQHGLPHDKVGLVINSAYGRTQNQLHIHLDCLRPDVASAVRDHAVGVGSQWAPFPVPLVGHPYLARAVASRDLSDANPFLLLADGVPGARADMGRWTLAVISINVAGAPGFVLLADQVDPSAGNRASGEELQDHDCAIKSGG